MMHMHRHLSFRQAVSGALVVALVVVGGVAGCGGGSDESAATPSTWAWALPQGFPVPALPADNPMSADKVDLGRFLFYDKRLSGNGTLACSSCHLQEKAFTDGFAVARGSTGEFTPRNSQSLGNVAYSPTLTWANPGLALLERQMEVPLFGENVVEMGINDTNKATVLQRLADTSLYPTKFARAFPGEVNPISWGNAIRAIAAFQRTLISGNSKYDQAVAGKAVLSSAEQRGKDLFFGAKAGCSQCHNGFNFNDQVVAAGSTQVTRAFHNIGLYNIGSTGAYPEPNRGVMELSGLLRDMGAFRAPSLRNVEVTAPYMHDGSIATLEAAMDVIAEGGRNIESGLYAGDGRQNPYKSPLVTPLPLTAQDKSDLVAFLKTLTDREFLSNPVQSDPFKVM